MTNINSLIAYAPPLKTVQDFLNASEITNLRATNRAFRNLITHTLNKRKKQISLLAQYLFTQLGKSILEDWKKREEYRDLTKDALHEKVHEFSYTQQSKALELFSKTVGTSLLCDTCIKAELVDVLTEPVFNQSWIEGISLHLHDLANYLGHSALDDRHVVHELSIPSHLLPKEWEDIHKLCVENYISKFISQIRDLPLATSGTPARLFSIQLFWPITQEHKNTLLFILAERCARLGHLLPCMLSCLRNEEERTIVKFEFYKAKKNYELAFDCEFNTTESLRFKWKEYLKNTIYSLVMQRKETRALRLLVNNIPLLKKRRRSEIVKLDKSSGFPLTLRSHFELFNDLISFTYHYIGLKEAIELAEATPFPAYRNYMFNLLILRLACPDIYISLFRSKINEYLFRDLDLEPGIKSNKDLDKAIELFNEFEKYKHPSDQVDEWFLWRLVYIIEGLLESGKDKQAYHFLSYFEKLEIRVRTQFLANFRGSTIFFSTWFERFKQMLVYNLEHLRMELKT